MNVYIKAFGCKVNQYDAQVIAEAFTLSGWERVETPSDSQLCIVAGCGVTLAGEAKAWRFAAKLARGEKHPRVMLAGCAAKTGRGRRRPAGFTVVETLWEIIDLFHLPVPPGISRFDGHTRAFVKIQDGCSASCAYCVIHKIRGPLWSKPAKAVVEEISRLAREGYSEVVLSGIHIGLYRDGRANGAALENLIEQLLNETRIERLRISSIEVLEVSDRLLDLLASTDRVAPHLHVPLQSGHDKVLRAMKRPYTVEQFLERVETLQNRLDRPAVSTDVMVGFPGESEEHFRATLAVMRRAGFSRAHVFPFSPRPGTPAASMDGRVVGPLLRERKHAALDCARHLAGEYRRRLVGITERVIVQKSPGDGVYEGLCGRFVKARFQCPAEIRAGAMIELVIESAEEDALYGRVV